MARFFGYRSVLDDLKHHQRGTGKIYSGTLFSRGAADTYNPTNGTAWANSYIPPVQEITGLNGNNVPEQTVLAYLWRLGETVKPRVDDFFRDHNGNDWLIDNVTTRLNADEDSNYAIYDCQMTRAI